MTAAGATVLPHVPIHLVTGVATVCGIAVSRALVMTGNPRRTTCRRCLVTLAYKRTLAGLRRHNCGGRKFTQPSLFDGGM